jgi:hypothetical protein
MRPLFCYKFFITFFTIFLPACCGPGLGGGTIDYWSEDVHKLHVTTDPTECSLVLANVISGKGATIETSVSPNDIYYTWHEKYGAFLTVSKEGYEQLTVKLNKNVDSLHVTLNKRTSKRKLVNVPSGTIKASMPNFGLVPGMAEGIDALPGLSVTKDQEPMHLSQAKEIDKKTSPKKHFSPKPELIQPPKPPVLQPSTLKKKRKTQKKITNKRPDQRMDGETKKTTGTVVVESFPSGAVLFIDGKQKGVTTQKLNLKTGKHKLTLRMNGYYHLDREITIKKDQTSRF